MMESLTRSELEVIQYKLHSGSSRSRQIAQSERVMGYRQSAEAYDALVEELQDALYWFSKEFGSKWDYGTASGMGL